jgi:ferrous iron transport protein B
VEEGPLVIVRQRETQFKIDYGGEIEAEIRGIVENIAQHPAISQIYDPRWLAIKLLEGESDLISRVRALDGGSAVLETTQAARKRLLDATPNGVEFAIADRRYAFVSHVVEEIGPCPDAAIEGSSERIDRIVTHPLLSLPIFFAVMYVVFNLVVNVSAPYLDWIDAAFNGPVTRWAAELLSLLRAPAWLQGLILDGVIAGVGGVLIFIPGLFFLFLCIGFLEDSGYLARAAVVMDRFMGFLGLRGKSFVPMILGFGCAVPAIYATRTLENKRDRLLTSLLIPLMSCSARMPVYVIFGLAFFNHRANWVLWGLYALGVFVAAVVGVIFSRTIFKRDYETSFVIELPPYQLPSLKCLRDQIAARTGKFIRNAGTVILAASVVIWLLLNMPWGVTKMGDSWFGKVGKTIAPVLRPAGFGNWESAGSLVSGLVAKEVVISTMSQIYIGEGRPKADIEESNFGQDLASIGSGFVQATGEAGKQLLELFTPGVPLFKEAGPAAEDTQLGSALQQVFTPLSALAFLVFVLLYVPCVATLGTIRSEFGWRWALFAAIWQTGVAWMMATLVYQGGRLLGFA